MHHQVARLHKVFMQVVHKSALSESSIALGRLNLTFYRLDYLYESWHTCSSCSWLQNLPQIFKILPRDLVMVFQSRNNGVKSSLNFEKIITKSLGKNLKYLRQYFDDLPFFFHSMKTVSVYHN